MPDDLIYSYDEYLQRYYGSAEVVTDEGPGLDEPYKLGQKLAQDAFKRLRELIELCRNGQMAP